MSFRRGGGFRGGGRGRGRGRGRGGGKPRQSKMMSYVNWRMRVTISDTRSLLGTFRAYDKHMNIILDDCDEYRKIKGKKAGSTEEREEKRQLGLVLLRGENVISMSTDSMPQPGSRSSQAESGPGSSNVSGRGMPVAPLSSAPKGLSGPIRGSGGPSSSSMQPISGQAVSYSRGSMPPRPPGGSSGSYGSSGGGGGGGGGGDSHYSSSSSSSYQYR